MVKNCYNCGLKLIMYFAVTQNYLDMEVVERLQLQMKRSFNKKFLEFTMRLAVVDEFGKRHPEAGFMSRYHIFQLNQCNQCQCLMIDIN